MMLVINVHRSFSLLFLVIILKASHFENENVLFICPYPVCDKLWYLYANFVCFCAGVETVSFIHFYRFASFITQIAQAYLNITFIQFQILWRFFVSFVCQIFEKKKSVRFSTTKTSSSDSYKIEVIQSKTATS